MLATIAGLVLLIILISMDTVCPISVETESSILSRIKPTRTAMIKTNNLEMDAPTFAE